MKECITHHHACDCREAEFAKLTAENEKLKSIVEVYEKANGFYASGESLYDRDDYDTGEPYKDYPSQPCINQKLIYGKTARQAKAEVERIRKGDGK